MNKIIILIIGNSNQCNESFSIYKFKRFEKG